MRRLFGSAVRRNSIEQKHGGFADDRERNADMHHRERHADKRSHDHRGVDEREVQDFNNNIF